jgi:hypothetical protein
MIFKLAGLDVKKLIEQGNSQDPGTIRERQYDLQDAGQILTSAIADRWAQSPYKVQFRADGQRFFTEIEELDRNIGMLPLEEQSRGFRWFFSFDPRFMHDSGGHLQDACFCSTNLECIFIPAVRTTCSGGLMHMRAKTP